MAAVLTPSTWSSVAVPVITGKPVGGSFVAVIATPRLTGALTPPAPSVSNMATLRVSVDGARDTLENTTARSNACTAAVVVLPFKDIVKGVLPSPPPAALPISTPP